MDPRHPELALPRVKELVKQIDRIEKDIDGATTVHKIGELEREGSLTVQELCLVAPRVHEALMQVTRNRRSAIARGLVEKPVMVKLERPLTEEEGKKIVESISTDKTEVKPAKPKAKKTTKKAKK